MNDGLEPIRERHLSKLDLLILNEHEKRSLFVRGVWRFSPDSHQSATAQDLRRREAIRAVRVHHQPGPNNLA